MGKKLAFITVSILLSITVIGLFLLVVLPDRIIQDPELEVVPEVLEEPPITFIDPIRGNENARITIVEYGDFACAFCKTLEPDLVTLIAEKPQQRRLIWKDAPNVGLHAEAFDLSMAARCAQDQGAFWEMHDRLLGTSVTPSASQLRGYAEEIGLDGDTFATCMVSEITRPIVQHTLDEAFALGIESTPALFINGERYEGPLTLDGLRQAVEAL